MMLEHDENREREVQALVAAVLDTSVEFFDDPNGPYTWSCPFCYAKKTGGYALLEKGFSMDDLDHVTECAYLIAKGLRT